MHSRCTPYAGRDIATVGLPPEIWRVLAKAHERRNKAEEGGAPEQGGEVVGEVIAAGSRLRDRLGNMRKGERPAQGGGPSRSGLQKPEQLGEQLLRPFLR